MATTLRTEDRSKLAAIIRAKVRRGSDATKAARVRLAMKRITDAFTWGALNDVVAGRMETMSWREPTRRGASEANLATAASYTPILE